MEDILNTPLDQLGQLHDIIKGHLEVHQFEKERQKTFIQTIRANLVASGISSYREVLRPLEDIFSDYLEVSECFETLCQEILAEDVYLTLTEAESDGSLDVVAERFVDRLELLKHALNQMEDLQWRLIVEGKKVDETLRNL